MTTRYQLLRRIGFDPVAAGVTAFLNWLFGVPSNEIHLTHLVIEFDPEEPLP